MKILNFGSLNLDYVYQMDHFVGPGETISSISRTTHCGGKGLNQSIALAKAGAEVWHAGAVGDQDGAELLGALKEAGVRADFVRRLEGFPSGHAIIQVDRSGQNCILLFGGANQQVTSEQIDEVLGHFESGDFLLLQNEINEVASIMERAHQKGMRIALNPSPMDEKILALPLEYVDYFILNEVEASQLVGTAGDLLEGMRTKFPQAKIVLTLGAQGSCYADGKACLKQAIFPTKVLDTTAAGDTFTGYFLSSLMQKKSVAESLRQAAMASSIAVSRAGAGPSIPALAEVLAALEAN